MCGIAGILSPTIPSRETLDRMGNALRHRGPDDDGVWVHEGIALVHRRLSIIDLDGGAQPMVSADGSCVIAFNGEIYNFLTLRAELEEQGVEFRTRSDTEVLLELYRIHGADLVKHLRGMFAFAIWDPKKRELLLARDHMGQKPLFYWQDESAFVFASEIKSILASHLVEPEVDLDTLWHYTSLRFCPGDLSLFKSIRKLPPGHTLVIRDPAAPPEIARYWKPEFRTKTTVSFDDAVLELDELLAAVTKEHLISDVPLGCFLSGGIDSSLVAALAARDKDDLPTFTIGVGDSDFSELPYAKEASDVIGSRHHEFRVDQQLFRLLPDIVWALEEPADPHSVGIYLVSKLTREHVTVALGGEGGDEVFGGYTRFARPRALDFYGAIPAWIRRTLLGPLLRLIPESYSYYSLASKAQWAHRASFLQGADRQYHAMTFFRYTEEQRNSLFTDEAKRRVRDADTRRFIRAHFDGVDADNEIDRVLHTEQASHLPEHFLLVADRMTMAHSLEARLPLIDVRIAEFAATLPPEFKIRAGRLKRVLREVACRYYPREFFERPKQGFGFPLARWFRGPLVPFLERFIDTAIVLELDIFDRDYVRTVIAEHKAGKDHNFRIWNLFNIEVWYRLFCVGQGREETRAWIESLLEGVTDKEIR